MESIEMIVIIYSLHPKSTDVSNIFDKGGSNGNSAILRPNFVKRPSSSSAER
jgi:hypothetical protein